MQARGVAAARVGTNPWCSPSGRRPVGEVEVQPLYQYLAASTVNSRGWEASPHEAGWLAGWLAA